MCEITSFNIIEIAQNDYMILGCFDNKGLNYITQPEYKTWRFVKLTYSQYNTFKLILSDNENLIMSQL